MLEAGGLGVSVSILFYFFKRTFQHGNRNWEGMHHTLLLQKQNKQKKQDSGILTHESASTSEFFEVAEVQSKKSQFNLMLS